MKVRCDAGKERVEVGKGEKGRVGEEARMGGEGEVIDCHLEE